MATTSPDSLRSPNPGDPYNLIADWATSMSSVQTALVRRANMFTGTSAQRTAFTTAPEGVHWQDTNGAKQEYVRQSGSWVLVNPPSTVLWSSPTGWVLDGTQTITLSETVSSQRTGIILVWSERGSDTNNQTNVVTKEQVLMGGHRLPVVSGVDFSAKYVVSTDNSLTGSAANTSGIRNNIVLRQVIGF